MARGSAPGERRGGRAKGKRNHASIAREKQVAITGITPLDGMIHVMRYYYRSATKLETKRLTKLKDETPEAFEIRQRKHQLDLENAMEGLKGAAREAAPFIHPKLATLQSNVNLTGRLTLEQLVEASLPLPANSNAALPAPVQGDVDKTAAE